LQHKNSKKQERGNKKAPDFSGAKSKKAPDFSGAKSKKAPVKIAARLQF